jgi:hypothetical protein
MSESDGFQFPPLSERLRAQMLRQALAVITAQHEMTETGGSILHHTLQGAPRHLAMLHYPKGDRIDAVTGAQYFYHAHRADLATEEHGHFHCFLRAHAVPQHLRPLPLPPLSEKPDAAMTHLVAIAMNRHGQAIRLFTVNRWVTSDIWYAAKHHPRLLKRFRFEPANDDPASNDPSADAAWHVLDGWVAGMLQLFAPQIAWLAIARDRRIAAWQEAHVDADPYDTRQLEELSSLPIDLTRQVAHLTDQR